MKKLIFFSVMTLAMSAAMAQQNQNGQTTPSSQNGKDGTMTKEDQQPKQNGDPKMLKSEDVPKSVRVAWANDYPNMQNEHWYKTDDGYVVYHITNDNQESRTVYDANGNRIMRMRELKGDKVPQNIIDYMKSTYPNQTYGKVYERYTEDTDKGYFILQNGKWIRFDEKGNVIQK